MLEETKQSTTQSGSTTGVLRSVSNQVLTAVGVGVLALPRALSGSGWGMGILLLLGTWALSQSMMHLLWKSIMTIHMKGEVRIESYGDLGGYAYGKVGRYAVAFATYTGLSAICVIIMILAGMSLFALTAEAMSVSAWIRISALILLPLSWLPTLKEVGILSTVGVFAVGMVGLVVLIGASLTGGEYRENIVAMPDSLDAFSMAFLEFMNSYTIAPVIPTIILGMKDPSKFPRVSTIAFAIISGCFAVIGFAGYFGWCDLFMQDKGINEILASTSSEALSIICQVSILIVSLSHFLVMFNPVALLSDKTISMIPGVSSRSKKLVSCFNMVGRSCLVGLMLAAALFVPSFFKVVDIVASTVVMPLQVIFPILFYCAICKDDLLKMSNTKKNVAYTLFVLAIAVALFAMGFGLYNVITHW